MELSIPLSKKNEPLFRQVYKGLSKAILSGAFPAGGRLPSTRDLAGHSARCVFTSDMALPLIFPN